METGLLFGHTGIDLLRMARVASLHIFHGSYPESQLVNSHFRLQLEGSIEALKTKAKERNDRYRNDLLHGEVYATTPSIAFLTAASIFVSIASSSSAVHVTRMLKLMRRLMTASLVGNFIVLRSCGRPSSWATSL
jgi:hypothetical protein